MKLQMAIICILLSLGMGFLTGCKDDGGSGNASDADTDTDSDGDADGDADGDTDADADGDTDADADGDTDTDADNDTDTDADGDTDTDADGDTDTDADGDTDTDSDSDTDTDGGTIWFVKQMNAEASEPATATISGGELSVYGFYSASSNAFKYDSSTGQTYANNNALFLVAPDKMSGDFSVTATVTVNEQMKDGNASGIAVGMMEKFSATSNYVYNLMRNKNNEAVLYYTKGEEALSDVGTGGTAIAYEAGDTVTITFRREGDMMYWNTNLADGSTSNVEQSIEVTTSYGCEGDVYVGLAYANVDATVTDFIIQNGDGETVFNVAGGTVVDVTPSSLTVSTDAVDVPLSGGPVDVTATAVAFGGAPANVSIAEYDETIVTAAVVNTDTGSTITLTPVTAGSTVMTVTNDGDTDLTAEILITVIDFADSDLYGELTTVYPAVGATDAYTDGEISITFDDVPVLEAGGSIRIYGADGTQVDAIGIADETQDAWGNTINVDDQLVRIDGNTVYVRPHDNTLAYGTSYYVAIPTTAIAATLNGVDFNGFSDDPAVATWNFTTRAAPTLSAASVTVDASEASTADFRSIQGALTALETSLADATAVTIDVAAGTYREWVYYKGGKDITIAGPAGNDRGDTCVIEFRNSEGMNSGTHNRAAVYFSAGNLVLKNLTIHNTWERSGSTGNQAESIYFANGIGKTFAAFNCSFISNQDTIQTTGKTWFYDCFIEGNTDYIWGTAQASLFENCSLHSVNDGQGVESHLFVSRTTMNTIGTPQTIGKGYVLLNSTVEVDSGMAVDYGRDAGGSGFYDQVALVNVTFSGEGMLLDSLWNNSSTYYYEGDASYVGWKASGCTGMGADTNTTLANTSAVIPDVAAEYEARAAVLNRHVTWDGDATFGYADDTASVWDLSALETDFGI